MTLLNEVIDRCPCYLTIHKLNILILLMKDTPPVKARFEQQFKTLHVLHLIIITVTLNKDSLSTTKIYNLK